MTGGNEYGKALFELAKDEGAITQVRDDLEVLSKILYENPDYIKLLDTPALSKDEKIELIDKAFSSLHYSVENLLKILCEKHLVYSYKEIFSTFSLLCDEFLGIQRAEVLTAVPLSPEREKAISEKLSGMTGKTVIIKNTVDPKILGGVILRFSGTQIDGSVKSRLDSFTESLRNINL